LGAARLWRDPGRGRACALAAVVPVAIAALLWLAGLHVFEPRALMGAAPFAALAIAAGLAASRRAVSVTIASTAAVLLVVGFARGSGRIVPDYDRVAKALVAEGWRPSDPIVLFGSVYDYLHPLDWYLPGSGRLEIAQPGQRPCSQVFVVAVGGRGRALTAPVRASERRVRSIVIAPVPWRAALWRDVHRRHGYLLARPGVSCARPPSG
jgi:hypothetical protein